MLNLLPADAHPDIVAVLDVTGGIDPVITMAESCKLCTTVHTTVCII